MDACSREGRFLVPPPVLLALLAKRGKGGSLRKRAQNPDDEVMIWSQGTLGLFQMWDVLWVLGGSPI